MRGTVGQFWARKLESISDAYPFWLIPLAASSHAPCLSAIALLVHVISGRTKVSMSDLVMKAVSYVKGTCPPLPVPALSDTLARYSSSIEPFIPPGKDAEQTKRDIMAWGDTSEALTLQRALKFHAAKSLNWLETWWEDYVYLTSRVPLPGGSNFMGVLPPAWCAHIAAPTVKLAVTILCGLQFYQAIPKLPREHLGSGQRGKPKVPLDMWQYERLFRVTRVPGESKDTLRELSAHRQHICVCYQNEIYQVQVVKGSTLISLQALVDALQWIIAQPYAPAGVSAATLTAGDRTKAAQIRATLAADSVSRASIEAVETSLFCVSCFDIAPTSMAEAGRAFMLGNGKNVWYDKPFSLICTTNGWLGMNAEHSWGDAIIMVRLCEFMACVVSSIDASGVTVPCYAPRSAAPAAVSKLAWPNIGKVVQQLTEITIASKRVMRTMDIAIESFTAYGQSIPREYRVPSDSWVQLALQLTYFRLHRAMVATYESAHTRVFHHGRTETIRSATPAAAAWCAAMGGSESSGSAEKAGGLAKQQWAAFKAAVQAHKQLVTAAVQGQGVDRHFMGLRVVAAGLGKSPKFFADPLFTQSSTWKLSTSNSSGKDITLYGGFMSPEQDGYGVAYQLTPQSMSFTITAWNTCPDTSTAAFWATLQQALWDMLDMAAHAKL